MNLEKRRQYMKDYMKKYENRRDKPKKLQSQRAWYAKNRLAEREKRRAKYQATDSLKRYLENIKAKYHVSPDRYQELYDSGCWLCGKPFETDAMLRPAVDHDHACCPGKTSCGKCVRGLAHKFCNHAIASEDVILLRAIADSLERYQRATAALSRESV